jgi:glyoxylase-like metal-dependent hydrolase (beta-lactamase superfamily II)
VKVYPLSCGLGIAFLIEAPQGLYLVDAGSPGHQERVLAKMKELGRTDLRLIWITHAHYDHYGSAAALRQITGAAIGVHPLDAGSMAQGRSPLGTHRRYAFIYPIGFPLANHIRPLPSTPPDFTREDGETLADFGLPATVLHTPGHTPGHTCLLLKDGTVFAGDLIGRSFSPKLQDLLATNWDQLPTSLAHLIQAQPQWVYTGHSRDKFPGSQLSKIKTGLK